MRRTLTVALTALIALPMGARAQEDLDAIAEEQQLFRRVEMYEQLGAHRSEALELAIITSRELSPAQMMMLLSRMRGGGRLDELWMVALMEQLGGGGGTAITAHDGSLFVAEKGWIYRIDPETLQVQDRRRYAPEAASAGFGPEEERLLAAVEQEAQRSVCLSNVKQLCLACLMYAQDWDEHFPGQDWAEATVPYVQNAQVYQCPSRPELPIGYAFNERLLGAALGTLTRPAETVMLFGSNMGGPNPVGGVQAAPAEGIHGEYVTVGFADGHVKMMTPEGLREALQRDPVLPADAPRFE